MKNTATCDECGSRNGHEIWCSLTNETIGEHPVQSNWIAVTGSGARMEFTLAPNVTLEFATRYGMTRLTVPGGVVSVEAA